MYELAASRPIVRDETWLRSRDVVCGMIVGAETAAGEAFVDGRVYRFCSLACRDEFLADPSHYLRPHTAAS